MIARTSIASLLARSACAACLSVMTFGAAKAQPVRGLYVAGAAGASFNQSQTVNPHTKLFPRGRDDFATGITGLGSVGWGLGNGFRVELEGNYRNNRLSRFHSPGFGSSAHGHQQKYGGMANALFDMDIGQNWIYPYFGAGIGYGSQFTNTAIQGTGADKGYRQRTRDSAGGFAYQGIFGLSLPVPWVVGLSTTMEYRFYTITGRHRHFTTATYNIANPDSGPVSGKRGSRTDFNHSLMLGLRYEFNPAPPAPTQTLSAPAPAPVRTYLVFFDWDRDGLSDRARAIVETAARNSTSAQFTCIQVNGHADSSTVHPGSKKAQAYNMALSLRRAQNIKAELIRDGVPAGVIDVHGFGDTQPLVSTRPGTAEPQNRRVEIDFQ